MNSVLEEQRRLHEERERLEDAMSKEFMIKKSSVNFFARFVIFASIHRIISQSVLLVVFCSAISGLRLLRTLALLNDFAGER
jgi:hypothetical protein